MEHGAAFSYGPPRDDADWHAFAEAFITSLIAVPPPDPNFEATWRERASAQGDARVVRRGDEVAGGLVGLRLGMWLGGRVVPVSGVTCVAVAPAHRSLGAATHLVREHIRELHRAGIPLAALYPATQPLYRNAGYERAGARHTWRIALRELPSLRPELPVRVLAEADHPRVRALYAARARGETGWFDRSEAFWRHRVFTSFRGRTYAHVFEDGGAIEAYVVFSHTSVDGMHYDLAVRDFAASTPRGLRSVLAFLVGHRSMAAHAVFHGAGVEPLLTLLEEQHRDAIAGRIDWMLRVVDVRGALAARGYSQGVRGELHLEVRDPLVAENNGRIVLAVEDGRGVVRPGGDGRLRLDIRALASLYTGYHSVEHLAQMGCAESDDGSAAIARAIFAGPAPSMPDMF